MTRITSLHGNGARSTHELIQKVFLPELNNDLLSPHDAAELFWNKKDLIITTDAHVIDPLFFPGGDIGKLSICGVVNDLLTRGGRPLYMSVSFIIEEGLAIEELRKIIESMAIELRKNEIKLVCADTKVIPARGNPGIFINSTLIGERINCDFVFKKPLPGDRVYLNKTIAEHGLTLLIEREKLPFQGHLISDCQSLYHPFKNLFEQNIALSYVRDCTRGGVATVAHELANLFSLSIELFESKIPVQKHVEAALQFLGLGSLEVANEGVLLIIAPEDSTILEFYPNLIEIGMLKEKGAFPVTLSTSIGGHRILPYPDHDQLPRIC
ncbi:MAG: hydrogenase expression/formation protein HypE [Bdellovibrio sp. CG12_big_fil_rev_8_21_14_0_65_39_13]|nr:MAG: hydrogenase expression/formation protein HypE [Bdellovibrio sp. CG22_combo_CG10-13_8_21_14_all_39_27]PIQ62991.1 MAG: hydrogenase expression/formation protein HypE [Bdellovibrio sp. CG12_big_fil_rev_8_21_14_0_65_39_13]PIR32665.1 MAG: hydrogenase expression/formation protein HypE [Bdellovibrio sp. CG11_big_fil_rev_8_21_14_0_20_39_38]PJB53185.1 MAG: hydrogenase expression/formation protein HypE [Bdellovibrio sp. CG_4_9_14_3_um_filter_39_7]